MSAPCFAGAIAIVTGGAAGIGEALCLELGRRGARVVVADRDVGGAERVAAAINAAGGSAQAVACDVTSPEQVRELVDATRSAHGRLDYMFNNAGIGFAGDTRDASLEQWRRVVDVNLMGVIYGTVAAYPVMVEQGSGHIVNTASMAGIVPMAPLTPYCAVKFGVVGLSTALRQEAAALGVHVSVVCPGAVATSIFKSAIVVNLPRERFFSSVPLKHLTPAVAALAILRGVARNDRYIVFPLQARLMWWLHRLSPALFDRVVARQSGAWRAMRGWVEQEPKT